VSERQLIDHVGSLLADHKRPRTVHFVDHVRRTPAGKPDRPWARSAASELEAGPSPHDHEGAIRA